MKVDSKLKKTILSSALTVLISGNTLLPAKAAHLNHFKRSNFFNRVASFPVFKNTDVRTETVAEIVAASGDGNTLIYTDGKTNSAGFVDITDPSNPKALGGIELSGEPTSIAVSGKVALLAVNTSENFINTSGQLVVVEISSQKVIRTLPLSGQPDSIAVSPDNRYAAIAIENERDEDLGNGEPPQFPAGFLIIVDLIGSPDQWTLRSVNLEGITTLFSNDPEPEYVDINSDNIAVLSLQENNHIILVDLTDGKVKDDFSAGFADLFQIDTEEEDPAFISQNSILIDVPREPDGVTWISNRHFVTANEGDLNGGTRGITIFNRKGVIKHDTGNQMDQHAIRLGHYQDDRSRNKGNEPENVEYAQYGKDKLLFVGSERSNLVFVYSLQGKRLKLLQTLPAGVGPEGLLAIPNRNLFIAASEVDNRGDKIRSVLNIYHRSRAKAHYPTVVSKNRSNGTPIPWGALSGLAMDRKKEMSPILYMTVSTNKVGFSNSSWITIL